MPDLLSDDPVVVIPDQAPVAAVAPVPVAAVAPVPVAAVAPVPVAAVAPVPVAAVAPVPVAAVAPVPVAAVAPVPVAAVAPVPVAAVAPVPVAAVAPVPVAAVAPVPVAAPAGLHPEGWFDGEITGITFVENERTSKFRICVKFQTQASDEEIPLHLSLSGGGMKVTVDLLRKLGFSDSLENLATDTLNGVTERICVETREYNNKTWSEVKFLGGRKEWKKNDAGAEKQIKSDFGAIFNMTMEASIEESEEPF